MMMDNSYRNNQSSSDHYPYHSYYNSQHSSPVAGQGQPVNQQMYTNYRDHVLDNGQSSWSQNDSMSWNSPQTPPESQPQQRGRSMMPPRPKLSTHLWEDEGTICYQVDARSICVARRQDNDMINGTKLLNVVGMSRGKRDGILKNEKGRVVVKVGSMHLKGVWITFARAKALAAQYKIIDMLYPLFVDDPSMFLYMSPLATGTSASQFPHFAGHYRNHPCLNTFNNSSWEREQHHEPSQSENRSTISPVTGKSLKLGTQDSSSSRLSMHSHNDIDLLGTGMEYRHPSSTNENSYNNGSASSASGMAVGGLVRSSNDQYADHYSQMPSGAPPDQGYDNGSFSANQHVAYPQVGLPPLLKTRSKSDDFHQGNGEMNDNNGSLLGKSSTLRSPYMPLPLAPASPNSLKNENHSIGSAPPYDQSLPPMVGSQQTEYYLLGGVSNMQSSKDGHGYENRGSGFVDVRRSDLS